MKKVFIDGSAGTTGLRIYERLSERTDIELILLPDELRKDIEARRKAINSADIVFLCLPDDAARESVSLAENPDTVIIDTSTAHRTSPDWDYGFPELSEGRERIACSKRIANPGCHASGFVSLVAPLTQSGLIDKDISLTCFSLTGYSGGGKKMIAEFEDENKNSLLSSPGMYGLSQQHKHLKDMMKLCQLENAPVFCPIVAPYYSGMEVTVPLFAKDVKGSIDDIKELYKSYYNNGLVHYADPADENGFIYANAFSGRDDMQITVCGNDERILLVSRFDNLGKGASGAAIQNMNIVLGVDEATGLNIGGK
ncbi:MAG: N-acetyl-gamma-glutamyl-phosphate reductase [Clostridia bacterium]|nr:N-acetyl-gamma-glutamyl-phosphate reductase [Clostridia bacterium]